MAGCGTAKSELNPPTNLVCHLVSINLCTMDVVAAPFKICLKPHLSSGGAGRLNTANLSPDRLIHLSILCSAVISLIWPANPVPERASESPAINIFSAVSPETDL